MIKNTKESQKNWQITVQTRKDMLLNKYKIAKNFVAVITYVAKIDQHDLKYACSNCSESRKTQTAKTNNMWQRTKPVGLVL